MSAPKEMKHPENCRNCENGGDISWCDPNPRIEIRRPIQQLDKSEITNLRLWLDDAYDVPEDELNTIYDLIDAYESRERDIAEAVAAEREACAMLVEDAGIITGGGYYDFDDGRETLRDAARAIRARGGK